MTRKMADSVTPGNLPPGLPLYGGYDDGGYMNVAQIRALEPGATVLAITTNPADNFGDCLDVETGDARPSDAPHWTALRRLAGHQGPLNYCSWALLTTVIGEFNSAHVPLPGFWVAGYPAPDGDAIPVVPGVNIVGHQWIDHGPWDESIMADYLPGIDPAPPTGEDIFDMLTDPGFAVRYLYRICLHREVDPGAFTNDVNFLNGGGTLNQLMTNIQDSPEGQAVIAAERKALGLV